MTVENKTTLKSYFETGDKPTQSQFGNLIDTVFGQGFINMETYGVSAGSSDNRAAIKAAISGANGRWLYIQASAAGGTTTYLTSPISSNVPARLYGDADVVIKQVSGGNRDVFYFRQANGVMMDGNFTIDANKAQNTNTGVFGNCIHMDLAHGFKVGRLRTNNAIGNAYRIVQCSAWSMDDVSGTGNVVNSIYTIGNSAAPVENFKITKASFKDTTGGDTYSFDEGTQYGQLGELYAENCLLGLSIGVVSSAGMRPNHIQVDKFQGKNMNGVGVGLLACRDIQIDKVTLDHTGYSAAANDENYFGAVQIKLHDNNGGIHVPTQNIERVQIGKLNINDSYQHALNIGIADGSGLQVNDIRIDEVIIRNAGVRTANSFDGVFVEVSGGTVNNLEIRNLRVIDVSARCRYAVNVSAGVTGKLYSYTADAGATGTIQNKSAGFYTNSMLDQNTGVLGLPICLARVNTSAGGANLVGPSINVSAVSREGTGDYLVKYKQNVSSANDTMGIATAYMAADQGPRTAQVRFFNTTEARVQVYSSSTTVDPTGFSLIVYGKHT